MSEAKWRCNHDEHINKLSELSCEICGNHRPFIQEFTYHLLEDFGNIKVSWSIENFKKGTIKYGRKQLDIAESKGELVLKEIRHKKKIFLEVENDTCEINEEKIVLLKEPEILVFYTSTKNVLENSLIDLTWETINATNVTISDLGSVSKTGFLKSIKPKSTFKIFAENEVGKIEQELSIEVLPLPKIKEFSSKQQKIEFGKETELIWDIENTEKVELHWMGNMEVVPNKGEKTISPVENTNYKLILTALDGTTKEEKIIGVEVFKRIEFKSFMTSSILIPRGLELELDFNVEHAKHIVLKSSDGMDQKVESKQVVKFFPTKSANYWLEARNDLFNSKSETIRVEVDNAPQMTKIPAFFEENQIPVLDFKLPELQSIILDETMLEFERMIHPKRSFSISKMLNSILKK